MRYALFLGCTIPARSRNYELSARNVAKRLGIELIDLEAFICCGFPMKAIDRKTAELMGAYNLALAQERDLGICTLCSSCASALAETAHYLAQNAEERAHVNGLLARTERRYRPGIKVRHFARILYEEVGLERIKETFERDLKGLKIAVHYGCHYLKPTEIYDHFDQAENPKSIDVLVASTGAEVVDYPGKKKCCGGPVLPVDEKVALSVAKEKLDAVSEAGADAMCLVCPFCSVMYDGNQRGIESAFGTNYNLPVLYLSQVLGLAMGFDRKELGLNMNIVKTKDLTAKLEPEQ